VQDACADFLWKQEFHDRQTGLVYLRARFYHPELMRFISMDSYPLANKYAFAAGDPVNQSDPSGHRSSAVMGDILGILLGLAGAAAAPFTGGTSLEVAIGVGAGVLGAASASAALANDATPGGDRAAAEVATGLAIAGFLLDFGSAAVSCRSVARGAEHAAAEAEAHAGQSGAYLGERDAGRFPTVDTARRDNSTARSYEVSVGRFSRRRTVRIEFIGESREQRLRFRDRMDAIHGTPQGRSLIRRIAATRSARERTVRVFLQARESGYAQALGTDIHLSVDFRPVYNVRGGGSARVESISRVLAHELGHVAYPHRSEQSIVDTVENPIARSLGFRARGRY
jgi:RHS repeat-associated protein